MEGDMELTAGQYTLIYNAFSFAIAAMGAATLFLWLNRSSVAPQYRAAVTISGLVTAIAFYHYWRIFGSWGEAYEVRDGVLTATGIAFNDAYRYVDWLLTVPLLLIELILVMRLPHGETSKKAIRLGFLAALMVILGYPGEVSSESGTRWIWWVASMIPFLIIVWELASGLKASIASQPPSVRSLVDKARVLTIVSWCFYPIVFIFPMIGFTGGTATTLVQVGYTVADLVAKAVFGILIYMIAVRKSEAEGWGVKSDDFVLAGVAD
jgi:bacteriorhodopsin